MTRHLLQRAAAIVWPATGAHRRVPAPIVRQKFVNCQACGVETAATVHGSQLLCTEGHLVGGAT
jgi:hypothetical protein